MTKDCEVLVIGGGPAGAAAAHALATAGIRTLVLEKAAMPRPKLCGGALSRRAQQYLALDLPREMVDAECNGVRLCHFGRTWIARRPHSVATLVTRARFDQFVLEQAGRAGAQIVFEQAQEVDQQPDGVRARAGGREYSARMGILACGAVSRLTRLVRPKDGAAEEGYCLEQEIGPQWLETDPHLIDLHFGSIRHGYGWVFPHGAYHSVGVGGLRTKLGPPREAMTRFWEALNLPSDSCHPRGWPVPCGGVRRCLARGRWLLAGDAAGLVDPFLGEGLAYALGSGRMAAACGHQFIQGKLAPPDLAVHYARRIERVFGRDLRIARRFMQLMYRSPRTLLELFCSRPQVLDRYLGIPAGETDYRGFFLWFLPRIPFMIGRGPAVPPTE